MTNQTIFIPQKFIDVQKRVGEGGGDQEPRSQCVKLRPGDRNISDERVMAQFRFNSIQVSMAYR